MPKKLISLLVLLLFFFIFSGPVQAAVPTGVACDRTAYPTTGCPTGQICNNDPYVSGEMSCFIPGVVAGGPAKIKSVNDLNKATKDAKNPTDPKVNLGSHASESFTFILTKFGCYLGDKLISCQDYDENGQPITGDSGLYGTLVAYIGDIYQTPPASGETYIADVMKDLQIGVAQPAYAQGIGFSALNPILSVWKTMRNIAYFFFIILFVFIGFMIMFRQKIGGQTVVTAQQAIPKIIVALLLVTFSYAIAGLLIDIMYLVMYFLASIFARGDLLDGNVFQMAGRLVSTNVAGEGADVVGWFVHDSLGGGLLPTIGGWLANISAAIIILLVIVFNAFKLFLALLKTYIELILNIAFAPLILMIAAVPGQDPFKGWFKNIIGNLAVFPAILVILIVFDVIRSASETQGGGGFLPPFTAGSASAEAIPFLAGLAMILALPQVVDETKKAFGVSQAGFFGNLMAAGGKNAAQAADIAIPALGAAGTGGYGLARADRAARAEGLKGRDYRRAITSGFSATDAAGNTRKYGGLLDNASRGWRGGQTTRKYIDNARDGRLFDPNNLYSQLEALRKAQEPATEHKSKTPDVAPPSV